MEGIMVEIEESKLYNIEKVADFTGYTTAYLRTLDRAGNIPKSSRDGNGWRQWTGADIRKIKEYRKAHQSPMTKRKNARDKKAAAV